jgi:hypothetical protein
MHQLLSGRPGPVVHVGQTTEQRQAAKTPNSRALWLINRLSTSINGSSLV